MKREKSIPKMEVKDPMLAGMKKLEAEGFIVIGKVTDEYIDFRPGPTFPKDKFDVDGVMIL